MGSNVVSELLGLFEKDAGVLGVVLRLYQGRGDGFSELGEVGSIWTGLDVRPLKLRPMACDRSCPDFTLSDRA